MSSTVVLDSSVWLEIFGSGPASKRCLDEKRKAKRILVPTVILYEVYRKIVASISEDEGLSAVAFLSQYDVADLDREVALTAADLSLQHQLAMADSLVLAHAQQASALLVTLDNDFRGIDGVKLLHKRAR